MKTRDRPAAPADGRAALSRPAWWVALAAALAAAGVYAAGLGGEFVYDDRVQVLVDPFIHEPGNLPDVLTFRILGRDVLDHNRPVQLASLMLDALIWGKSAFGFRLTNLLLHAACTAALTLWMATLVPDEPRRWTRPALALAAGLLFALHPVTAETVSSVSFREDLLFSLFTLLALTAASRVRRPSLRNAPAFLLLALLAVGSKEAGVVVGPLLLLYGLLIRPRDQRRAWVVLAGACLAVAGAFLAARFALAPEHSTVFLVRPPRLGGSWRGTLEVQPRLWWLQLLTLVQPGRICADYGPWSVRGFDTLPAVAGLAAVAAGVAAWAWRRPRVLLAAGLYVLPLAPVSNLVPMYIVSADRYLYLPLAGCALALALAGSEAARRLPGRLRFAVVPAVLLPTLLLLPATAGRIEAWQSRRNLWTDTVEHNPNSRAGHNNLAFSLFEAGRYAPAVDHWRVALRITKGGYADVWAGLALGLDALGRPREAEAALANALELQPLYGDPEGLRTSLFWEADNARRLLAIVERRAGGSPAP